MTLRADLQAIADVREDEPMARHTTFGVGGPADFFVVAASQDELRRATLAARQADTPVFILGSGSNSWLETEGSAAWFWRMAPARSAIRRPERGSTTVTVDSGVPFASFTRNVARRGLHGLEWAAGDPRHARWGRGLQRGSVRRLPGRRAALRHAPPSRRSG